MPGRVNDLSVEDFLTAEEAANPRGALGKIADLLERNGISIEDVGRVHKVSAWQSFFTHGEPCENCGGTGDDPLYVPLDDERIDCPECSGKKVRRVAEPVDLVGIQLAPKWAEGPEWPVVQPAAPTIVRYATPRSLKSPGRVTVLLPDPQVGYRRYADGELDPMHDEKALAVTLQLIALTQPDVIINLGDFLDASEWSSKFTVYPEFVLTTQPALDRGHLFLAQQRAQAGPRCEIKLLGGNHDDRIGLAVAKNCMAALRLRQAGKPPDSWPALSLPHLLNLELLDVEYVGAYPAGRIKVADRHGELTPLYALHGEKLDVAKVAKTQRQSYVQGHAHHVALHTETYEYDGEPEQVQAWSLGCLCRLDGAVPSTRGGSDDWGRPVKRWESWQHAAAVVTETESGWWLEPVFIHDGKAMYRGAELCGT